jgi:glycerol transport system ATP-binding protein
MTLELKGVTKRSGADMHIYPTDLTLDPGGFNVLLGATGAGKTTLIKMMAGLDKPTTGEIWFNGQDVTDVSPQRRKVSLVHQFFVNYPHVTVYENIASPLRIAGLRRAEIDKRVHETAELLRLTPMLKRRPAELSGGQQQRTAIARAIVKDADLVLLDEPLANLDYKLREELRDELPKLLGGRGAIVVYATSEPSEALLLGGSTATMHQGRITQFGPTPDVYRSPMTLQTAEVFSDPPINIANAEKSGGRIILPGTAVTWEASGAIASAPDGGYMVAIRPHFVSPRNGDAGSVRMKGRVLVTELSGSESVAHFAIGDGNGSTGAVWVSQSHGVHVFQVGETHEFYVDVSRCLYFDPSGNRVGG